jgi:hypothetical protein
VLEKRSITHALLALIIGLAIFVPSAKAGTYTVPFCDRAASLTTSTWTHSATLGSTSFFYMDNSCSSHRIYRRFVEGGTIPAGASDDWTFDAPTGTYVNRLDVDQSATPRSPGAMIALYSWQQDGSRSLTEATRSGETQGNRTYYFPVTGSKVVKLRDSLMCQDGGGNCDGIWGNMYGNEHYFYGALVYLTDPSVPAFSSVGGDGWSAAPSDGQRSITYSASDSGAGLKEAQLYMDGALASKKIFPCAAERLVPCPLTGEGSFTYDTARLAEGQHDLELHLIDGSLNEEIKPLSFTVRRAPAAPGNGSTPVSIGDASTQQPPAVGDQLEGSNGSWTGTDLTFTYRWLRCDSNGTNCVPIPGATGVDYTPTSADIGHALQFCVTASNSGGSATSCSDPTAPVVASHPPTGGGGTTTTTADPVERPGTPASNTTPTSPSSTAAVDRGAPNGTPAADRVLLTALANNRSSTIKVKFGKRVPISGKLVGPSGAPIANAILEVQTRTAVPGAAVAAAGKVVTGQDGRFTYMAPAGPSRVVRIAYRSHSGDASFADTSDVTLLVSAGVTIKATPKAVHNRHATVFTGRLLGKPISKRGVVVDLQVFFRRKWRTFGAPRTNRAGKYKFKYRFMAGAATWKFRARVRRETSYPYTLGYSGKTVKVKVLP